MRERYGILGLVLWYEDPYAKFRRAGKYLHALYADIAAFLKSQPYDVLPKMDDDGWVRGRFQVIKTPPDTFALTVGDFVQNLRASLDHSIYALATVRTEQTEYPIHSQEDQYLGLADPAKPAPRDLALAYVPDEYRAVVDASQPYQRGNVSAARKDPLAILAWLSNVDKHRLIHPAFHRQHGAPEVQVTEGRLSDIKIRRDIPLDQPVSDGTVVSAWRPKPGKEFDVSVNVYVEFTVAFSERALGYVELEGIWNYVGRVINTLRAVSEGQTVTLDTTWPIPSSWPKRRSFHQIRPKPNV